MTRIFTPTVSRTDTWTSVEEDDPGVSVTVRAFNPGRAQVWLRLDDADEILIHRDDMEIYIALDRLSALRAVIEAILVETKVLAQRRGEQQ